MIYFKPGKSLAQFSPGSVLTRMGSPTMSNLAGVLIFEELLFNEFGYLSGDKSIAVEAANFGDESINIYVYNFH